MDQRAVSSNRRGREYQRLKDLHEHIERNAMNVKIYEYSKSNQTKYKMAPMSSIYLERWKDFTSVTATGPESISLCRRFLGQTEIKNGKGHPRWKIWRNR